ncbi:S8 family serine peptidase [Robertkochia flava]|uniref:S8 family serine peptidase n=1 Tax=Robertkochia flava TaxID=3447986 RepID=UPI001CCA8D34|nr:S8 family serine peptidase [Robertkochia marina]
MKNNYHSTFSGAFLKTSFLHTSVYSLILLFVLILSGPSLFAQGKNDIGARACVQDIGNGLYQANFTYENPQRREVSLRPEQSLVKFEKGKRNMQGITNFKPGIHKKAFSLVFSEGETVTWIITYPSGNEIVVEANSSASFCQDVEETNFIFPVYAENGKTSGLLDPSSYALATGNEGEQPSDIIYQLKENDLLVEVIPNPGQLVALINLLQNTFGLNNASGDFLIDPQVLIDEAFSSVDCFVPVGRLLELNNYPDIINFVRTNYVPLFEQNGLQGVAFSEGDSLQGSLAVRKSFGTVVDGEARFLDGFGFSVGVISDSFDKLPSPTGSNALFDEASGDLPGPDNPNGYSERVTLLEDYPGLGGTDEGRAMLQIIHDVAPASKLAFHYAITDQVFGYAVDRLSAQGVDLIGDDITFVDEEFDGDGPAGQAIRDFLDKGDRYFVSAAGNFIDKSFTGAFTPSSQVPVNNFQLDPQERAHVFGTNPDGSEDYLLRFRVQPGVYLLAFQWDQEFASTNNQTGAESDLDMYVVDDLGRLLVGNNSFSLGRDALEIMTFSVTEEGEANLMIVSEQGALTPQVPFRVIAFRYQGLEFLEYGGAPTISGHASINEVITVGAVNAFESGSALPRSYSSYGGVISNSSAVYPDIAAPDGVSTAVEGFERFFGTSAAAPHVMGAIALLKPAYDIWTGNSTSASAQAMASGTVSSVFELYRQFALPAGNPDQTGAGFIDVESTVASLAARAPVIESLDPPVDVIPSSEAFQLSIKGQNFNSSSQVFLNGTLLEVVSISDTEIVVNVPEFEGAGIIYVTVEPVSQAGTEIVTSNEEDLLEDRRAITIEAQPLEIVYGQPYEFEYTVKGLPEGTTYADTGLPEITFSTPAVAPYPDVRSYTVIPEFTEDPEPAVLEEYIVNFKSSVFTVTKRGLTIKPLPATYTYGDLIDLEMEYIFDDTENTPILNEPVLRELVASAHASGYFEENTFALLNRFRTVLNGEDILSLLNNNAWMVSENTIQNRFRTVLNGMDVIDLEMDHFEDYINATDPVTNRFRTVLNRFRTVLNGQDFFDGLADVEDPSITNRFRTVLNETSFGDEDDDGIYAKTFTIIDETDLSTDSEDRAVQKLYALNLITGLGVTTTEEGRHYTYPGVLLHPIATNFNVIYDLSRLVMNPATLSVTTGDLIVEQGSQIDPAQIEYSIAGYEYGEAEADVFPNGVEFTFADASGMTYEQGDFGVFYISIEAPQNYLIENTSPGVLYVNPTDGSKIRTYLDCVQLNPNAAADGYTYIANFRYVNPNEFPLYLFENDNYIEAEGMYVNNLPTEFLPGEHYVQIPFDGKPMTWNVCTFGSCNPSSTGSESTLDSKKCSAKDIETITTSLSLKDATITAGTQGVSEFSLSPVTAITAYPNPVAEALIIHPGQGAVRTLQLYDIMGRVIYERITGESGTGVQQRIVTDDLSAGIYMLKVVTTLEEKVIKVVKQ